MRIRCNHLASLYSWSKSEDGSAANAVILDTSSDRYTVVNGNSLDIWFSNVTGEDGGLYRCVYDGTVTTPELCVYVYGKSTIIIHTSKLIAKNGEKWTHRYSPLTEIFDYCHC